MKEILNESFKKEEDYAKFKNYQKLYDLSFYFSEEFKKYVKEKMRKSL